MQEQGGLTTATGETGAGASTEHRCSHRINTGQSSSTYAQQLSNPAHPPPAQVPRNHHHQASLPPASDT